MTKLTMTKKQFKNNKYKNEVNKKFFKAIQTNLKSINLKVNKLDYYSYIGTLDSIERNTSKQFLSNGLKKYNFLLIEHNKKIAKDHFKNGFPTHFGSLEDFSKDKYDKEYNKKNNNWRNYKCYGFNFDMFGAVRTQQKGILNTIKKINIMQKAVLSFTFCCSRPIKFIDHVNDFKQFRRNLRDLIKSKGFNIKQIYKKRYRGDCIKKYGADMQNIMYEIN
jgi:hypothetical protein